MAEHDPDLQRQYQISVGVKVQLDYLREPEGLTEQTRREYEQAELDAAVMKAMTDQATVHAILRLLGLMQPLASEATVEAEG